MAKGKENTKKTANTKDKKNGTKKSTSKNDSKKKK